MFNNLYNKQDKLLKIKIYNNNSNRIINNSVIKFKNNNRNNRYKLIINNSLFKFNNNKLINFNNNNIKFRNNKFNNQMLLSGFTFHVDKSMWPQKFRFHWISCDWTQKSLG